MIQIESVRIKDLRGIRELEIRPDRKNFLISGPNGSGKSGVVDAIQFGLTGEMSRLEGKGTGGLSVQRHGPHVDRRDDPAAAEVSMSLYIPECEKSAVLTRNVKTAKSFTLEPDDPEIRAAIEEAAQHPELSLSRREIIKYIIVESGQRSKEIQALLKLETIGDIRSTLKTTTNGLSAAHTNARQATISARDSLRRHLDTESLDAEEILAAVNPRRKLLGLAEIPTLKDDTALNEGVSEVGTERVFNKQSAIGDIEALQTARAGFATLCKKKTAVLLEDLRTLEADPALLDAIRRRFFVERGLGLVDGAHCPLCDQDWEDEERLKDYLKAKLKQSEDAEKLQQRILQNGAAIASQARSIGEVVDAVLAQARKDGPEGFVPELTSWLEHLKELARSMGSVDEVLVHKETFESGWIAAPEYLKMRLEELNELIKAKPDQSARVAAQTFLTLAHDRLEAWRRMQREEERAATAAQAGRTVYTIYCDVSERELVALYREVEDDFSNYYRDVNADDESGFRAKLEPDEGGLDLAVAFYDRGMYPPGAYHSEGHQDGMGLCLYLALMKRQLGTRFRFAVLDDVVMSVDHNHRKQVCKVLKSRFQETQFIITTHDKVWAKQMQTEGLVDRRRELAFTGWNLETGPIFEADSEAWDQIEKDIEKNDIAAAAARLRRHLEYAAAELADRLGAKIVFRGDFSYDLGDLVQPVIGRHGDLLKKAANAANSWDDNDARVKVEALKASRKEVVAKCEVEKWTVNPAVHYNEWANFSKPEFRAVAEAFRELLEQFRCPTAECGSWLYVTPPKGEAEALRCHCTAVNLNLKVK